MMGLSHSLSESPILILLLICHFFADFHLQSQEVADKKGQGPTFSAATSCRSSPASTSNSFPSISDLVDTCSYFSKPRAARLL